MTPESELSSLHPVGIGYLDDASRRALRHRLSRLEGHLRAVKAMLEEGRCADEILLQTAAAKAGLTRFASVLLEHEPQSCVATCMEGDTEERLGGVTKVLATLLKQS